MSFLPAGSLPYLVPYGVFLVLVELHALVPGLAPLLFPLRVALPAALLVWYWRRGAYAELRGYRVGAGTLADVLAGVAIAALWVAPFVLWPALAIGEPFDAAQLGEGRQALALGLRFAGFALVTPWVEELFVRSFLLRFAETFDRADFRSEPIGRFGWRGFAASVFWFTFSHAAWEWGVALAAGVAFNAWLYARKHLMACVVAHAAANAAMWAFVVLGPASLWGLL
jgi:CAAX prenyl protease-like protein